MAIKIVDDACVVTGNQGTIIVEGANPEVVGSTATKREVLTKAAALGLSRPGISGQGGAYPVTPEGEEITDLGSGVPGGAVYRNDFQVTSGI